MNPSHIEKENDYPSTHEYDNNGRFISYQNSKYVDYDKDTSKREITAITGYDNYVNNRDRYK